MPEEKATIGSGNVFEDLGFPNAKVMKYKADLLIQISKIIKQRKWTQVRAAKELGIPQPKLSGILSGRVSVTIDKLVAYLEMLGYEVEMTPKKARSPMRKQTGSPPSSKKRAKA